MERALILGPSSSTCVFDAMGRSTMDIAVEDVSSCLRGHGKYSVLQMGGCKAMALVRTVCRIPF